eukprot:s1274_g2.t1
MATRYADGLPKILRNFDFLGVVIGDYACVRSDSIDRAAKIGDLLDSIGELEKSSKIPRPAFLIEVRVRLGVPEASSDWLTFVPTVVETTGLWEAATAKVLKRMAHAAAARSGGMPAEFHCLLLQEPCVTVRSWRAKAVLRCRFEAAT